MDSASRKVFCMSDGFYRAFEVRYRGSRELIKERLAAYLPFVEPLLAIYPAAAAIDLGCGRGEWLELLAGAGFNPMGVDLDIGMLEACFERGLPVEQGDALAYVSALPDESQAIVSAFHVVEHITFDQLRILVAEALRVLKPGGLLIMETPNPENIVVATCNFYLDPTHQRPIPSMLLAFVAEYAGFYRVKTLRLQESRQLIERNDISLQDVFAGASPDYAVVAQKCAYDQVLKSTSASFSIDYGLSLEDLVSRWDRRFVRLETKAQQAETKAQQAETRAQQAETKAQQAETTSNERLAQLQEVYVSTSWSVTKPLRAIRRMLAGDFAALKRSASAVELKSKQKFRLVVSTCIAYVNKKPALRDRANRVVKKIPALHHWLLSVAVNARSTNSDDIPASFRQFTLPVTSTELYAMTSRACEIYQNLKEAIENRKNGAV